MPLKTPPAAAESSSSVTIAIADLTVTDNGSWDAAAADLSARRLAVDGASDATTGRDCVLLSSAQVVPEGAIGLTVILPSAVFSPTTSGDAVRFFVLDSLVDGAAVGTMWDIRWNGGAYVFGVAVAFGSFSPQAFGAGIDHLIGRQQTEYDGTDYDIEHRSTAAVSAAGAQAWVDNGASTQWTGVAPGSTVYFGVAIHVPVGASTTMTLADDITLIWETDPS